MMTCSSVAMLMKRFIFWGIVICLLASCIEAQTISAQITSPPPLSTGGEYPCPAGDAKCFCKWKNGTLGMFADKKAGCAKYFWCTDFGPLYESCPSGLLFSDQLMVCNWPSQVSCGPPAPSPPPSPSPSPSPMDSRVPVTSSPPPSPVVQPPLPLSTGGQYPCPAGDAKCFCKWKNGTLGMFADKKAGCAKYFWCTDFGPLYESCPSGLLFSDQLMVCNWPSQVSCGPPVPSPPPSPPPPPFPPPPPIPPPPPPLPPAPPAPPGGRYQFAGYFQSWSDKWTNDANMSALANLPPYVTTVILSFMTPDTRYGGGITWSGTGLQFSSDPAVVKDEIALLKSRNPNTKVLVAVGGATYPNFANLNATAIALFVKTFGLDGVDLDFEPGNPSCSAVNGSVSCASDSLYITSVRELRKALPKGSAILTAATWSVGAYGEGQWASAPPASPYTGVALTMLKTVGSLLDSLHVMGYDAGLSYSPLQAYNAYRHYYPSGDILMGVEVPIEFGGHILTLPELDAIASYMKSQGGQGIMLFSLQKRSGTTLTAEQISQRICIDLNLEQCSCGLYCLPS